MKTVQMTLDETLLKEVDKIVKKRHTTRSAFTRKALLNSIKEERIQELEEKQIKGYKNSSSIQDDLCMIKENEMWDNFNDTW